MNKNVLKVMLVLVITFLLGMYILKFFFPEEFMMVITLDTICSIGAFVDNNLWLHIILGTCTSFLTYWLYLCAATHQRTLNKWLCLAILIISLAAQFTYYFVDATLGPAINMCAMFILPAVANASIKDTALIFSVHYAAQWLSINIRSLPMQLLNVNYATIFLLGIESYFWLLLFYCYFNYKRRTE